MSDDACIREVEVYCAALAAAYELAAGYRPPHTHVVLLRWDLKLFEVKANF